MREDRVTLGSDDSSSDLSVLTLPLILRCFRTISGSDLRKVLKVLNYHIFINLLVSKN